MYIDRHSIVAMLTANNQLPVLPKYTLWDCENLALEPGPTISALSVIYASPDVKTVVRVLEAGMSYHTSLRIFYHAALSAMLRASISFWPVKMSEREHLDIYHAIGVCKDNHFHVDNTPASPEAIAGIQAYRTNPIYQKMPALFGDVWCGTHVGTTPKNLLLSIGHLSRLTSDELKQEHQCQRQDMAEMVTVLSR